jgi:hypothetical protein
VTPDSILIVDDNIFNIFTLHKLVKRAHPEVKIFEVTKFLMISKGLKRIKSSEFDRRIRHVDLHKDNLHGLQHASSRWV